MNELPRRRLCELIARDPGLTEEPQRCEALLRDLCGGHKPEIHVLVGAAREYVPAELVSSQFRKTPDLLVPLLAKRLQDNLALSQEAALWAVESWALALRIFSPAQLTKGRL